MASCIADVGLSVNGYLNSSLPPSTLPLLYIAEETGMLLQRRHPSGDSDNTCSVSPDNDKSSPLIPTFC